MRPALKFVGLFVLAAILLTLASCSLYRHFVSNQIMDGGGMENPDAVRDGMELIEFSWHQNHASGSRCFALDFYLEDEIPVVSGTFQSRNSDEVLQSSKGASSKVTSWPLTWVQWFDLQHTLAATELPEYRIPAPDASDETASRITIVWRDGGEEKAVILDGSNAETLEAQVLDIAQEAYDAAKQETE